MNRNEETKDKTLEFPFTERQEYFLKSMLKFLSSPSDKYEKLLYSYIWITCYYFKYCNDPLRTMSIVLQCSTKNISEARDKLINKGFISSKPYIIYRG